MSFAQLLDVFCYAVVAAQLCASFAGPMVLSRRYRAAFRDLVADKLGLRQLPVHQRLPSPPVMQADEQL